MRFIIDANMPRSAAIAVRGLGHESFDVRDLGMAAATDSQIALYAKSHALILVTRDGDFADIRNYPPQEYHGIVILVLPDHARADIVTSTLVAFVLNEAILNRICGHLAIVEPGRVRLRPA